MYKLILSLLCLFATNLGFADQARDWSDWTDAEKAEYIAFTFVNYTDFAQTELCISQKIMPCEEQNPIFGKYPNDSTLALGFLSSQAVYYLMIRHSDQYPVLEKTRWFLFGTKMTIVWANDYNGIRVNKVW
jgi:hypothetical protein